ncbi:MAG: cell division protein FtsZ, partial [Alphaproteobacteria bacterium]|nr:cell division protein FtsZ [Alphaproteobacteria bacterium]
MGKAMMGTGEAEGDDRARAAAEAAISNPLLDDVSMKGARGVLINITGGSDMTLFEVDEAANRIGEEVDSDANIIFGSAMDPTMDGKLRVSVVATGIDIDENAQPRPVLKVFSEPVARMNHKPETPANPVPAEYRSATALHAAATAKATAPRRSVFAMDNTPPAATGTYGAMPAPAPEMIQPEPAVVAVPEPTPAPEASATIEREAIHEAPAAEAADAGAPEPAPAAQRESFIPPPPVEVARAERTEAAAPDPYRAAEFVNGSAPPDRRRAPNLFRRMTESALGRKERPEIAEKPAQPAAPRMPEPRAAMPEPRPQPAAAPAPAPAKQSRLDGVDPQDRLQSSRSEEDLLDIPAFLRRQAN